QMLDKGLERVVDDGLVGLAVTDQIQRVHPEMSRQGRNRIGPATCAGGAWPAPVDQHHGLALAGLDVVRPHAIPRLPKTSAVIHYYRAVRPSACHRLHPFRVMPTQR